MMIIAIHGVNFKNKGAELMLREIVRRLRQCMPEAVPAVSSSAGTYAARAELGLYQIPYYRRYRTDWGKLSVLIPSSVRKHFGVVTYAEADVILDASGYSYGDTWSPRRLIGLARQARRARRKGRKLVLLPQAFGPFTEAARPYMQALVENANLVFPRDEVSYRWIVDLAGERDNVRIAPDFTATLPGFLRPEHEGLRGRFCVIPNMRMIDKAERHVRDEYIPLMQACLVHASDRGARPYVLIHESGDDALARKVVDGSGLHIDIVHEMDARAIKGIIGAAGAVVSSRFHGLVSALSQGVPALGTSWSHKYAMLFRDYDFEEGVIAMPDWKPQFRTKLDLLLDAESRARLTKQLRRTADRQREAIDSMWRDVFAILRVGLPVP